MNEKKTKAITIGSLFRVDVGNVNASWPEGVVTVLKKVEVAGTGKPHPYISGQAMRHYIRETMKTVLPPESFSPEVKTADDKAPVVTAGDPSKYVDDDLFGFMRAEKKETKKRESPLRTSVAFGLFPYAGDRDLGTRSAVQATEKAAAGGSIFETEITNNIFRFAILLELDRVGAWKSFETTNEKEPQLGLPERKKRVMAFIETFKYLWGGGRRSRLLVNLAPQFLAYARMTKKVPVFLHSLDIRGEGGRYLLDIEVLRQTLDDYKEDMESLVFGLGEGFLGNRRELESLTSEFGASLLSPGKAIEAMIADIEGSQF